MTKRGRGGKKTASLASNSLMADLGAFPSLPLQKQALLLNHIPLPLAVETAYGAVRGNDPVARHLGCKGIALERLTHGLGASASYAACQFAVGDGFATWHVQEFQIHAPLEWGDVRGMEYPFPYVPVHAHVRALLRRWCGTRARVARPGRVSCPASPSSAWTGTGLCPNRSAW